MLNLCIDIGNTRAKIALMEHGQVTSLTIQPSIDLAFFEDIFKKNPVQGAMISSVRQDNETLAAFLKKRTFFLQLNHTTRLPIQKKYATPKTLGNDRIAGVVGANALFAHYPCLVIDAGTCITYDFIDAQAVYHGGSIAPGMYMKFNALHTFTAKLPLVQAEKQVALTGNSTQTSILSGVIWGTIAEIEGIIARYRVANTDLKVLITGGDAQFFESMLKSEIFVFPNLVLQGLNKILDYNVSMAK